MALTLVEASKYSNDVLQQGVIETFVRDDPVAERMKFKTILGNALSYNRETGEADAEFKAVNDTWTPTNQEVTKYTATLKILGNAARIDDFIRSTRQNINDVRAEMIAGNAKAVKKAWGDGLIYGNETADPKSFDGAHKLIANTTYNTILADSGDTQTVVLSLSTHLDKALDMVKGFRPACIVTSKGLRRGVTKYLRSVGSINTGRDEFGHQIMTYGSNDVPWYASDYILDTELTASGAYSAKTGGLTTSIFILSFEEKAFEGLHARPMEVTPWETVPGTNVEESKIRWYVSLMMESLVSCVKIVGIDADGTVAA